MFFNRVSDIDKGVNNILIPRKGFMDIVIGLFALVIGAFASYYILNKKLLALSEKNIQLKTTLNEKEKNYAEKLEFIDQLKSQVNIDFKNI